jgi:hypothetical protein
MKFSKGHKIRNTGKTTFKKGVIPWNKGKCGVYSKEHLKEMSILRKGKPLRLETRKNMSLAHKGIKFSEEHINNLRISKLREKNPNWKKDRTKISKDRWGDVLYIEWSKKIHKRDSSICRLKSKECRGKIEAHHIFNWIDYPELKYLESNGICVCQFHHPQGRTNEERMRPIFQELIG